MWTQPCLPEAHGLAARTRDRGRHPIEGGNGGPVYIDPSAQDGQPFKLYCIQRGGAVAKRAEIDEDRTR